MATRIYWAHESPNQRQKRVKCLTNTIYDFLCSKQFLCCCYYYHSSFVWNIFRLMFRFLSCLALSIFLWRNAQTVLPANLPLNVWNFRKKMKTFVFDGWLHCYQQLNWIRKTTKRLHCIICGHSLHGADAIGIKSF